MGSDQVVSDCLLFILIDNAHNDSSVFLQTLQLVEAFLDNPNERILHAILFQFVNSRGYHDKPKINSADETAKVQTNCSETNNILKIINK